MAPRSGWRQSRQSRRAQWDREALLDAGRDLLEQFQQFRARTEFECDETGGVAAGV
jgi:hypothetical protein